jgi:hypothetical protein
MRFRQRGQLAASASKPRSGVNSHLLIYLKWNVCPHGWSIASVLNGSKQIGQFGGSSVEGNGGAVFCPVVP